MFDFSELSEQIGFWCAIFSHLPHLWVSPWKSSLLKQYLKIKQTACIDLLRIVLSTNLCKQNFIKAIDERLLGLRWDFWPSHMIKQSVDVAYLTGFDLMNPCPPPLPKLPKVRLKDFFHQLQEDWKLMVAKLKMVCARHWIDNMYKEEKLSPPDIVGAIWKCIKVIQQWKT